MPAPDFSVPATLDVSVSDVVRGTFGMEGDLAFNGSALAFTFVRKGIGNRVSDPQTLHLPLDGLRAVELRRGLPGATITVYPASLVVLEGLPGATPGKLVFKVKAADRARAAALAARVQQALTDAGPRVPFSPPETGFRLTQRTGLLFLEGEFLVFEVGVGMAGFFQDAPEVVKIECRALAEVAYRRGLRSDQLVVRPKTRALIEALAGGDADTLVLAIPRKHRADAEQLAHETRRLMRAPR